MVGSRTISYLGSAVPKLSFHIDLEGLSIAKLDFYFPWHGLGTPLATSHLHLAGPTPPTPPSLHGLPHAPNPHMCGNSSSLGTNVTVKIHQNYKYPDTTSQYQLGCLIRILVILVWFYCHIGSQRGQVPTQVQARSLGKTRQWRRHGRGGAKPNEDVI